MDDRIGLLVGLVAVVALLLVLLGFSGSFQGDVTDEPVANDSQGNGTAGMANPAAVYCEERGGEVVIKDTNQGEAGYCLIDGKECEEWEYFRSRGENCTPYGQETVEKCGNYTRNGTSFEVCATCGNGVCEEYEECTSSIINCGEDGCVGTMDCGPIYCPEDCQQKESVNDFESCMNAGYPIMESYPRKCRGPEETYTEELDIGTCENDSDCKLPMEFAMSSKCPYEVRCVDNVCEVYCPWEGDKTYCTPEQRNAEICTMQYEPVCGQPSGETYSNPCTACLNSDVEYWTEGECPK
jgi:putative hemolysin